MATVGIKIFNGRSEGLALFMKDCHRPVADNFDYFYDEVLLYEDGTAGIGRRDDINIE